MKDAARKWLTRFLQNGHLFDDPPHQKGYKMAKNKEHLAAIRKMILKGYKDREGNTRLYSSLEELQSLRRDEFNEHFHATGLKTLRGLWLQLQTQYPKLRRVSVRLKKDRDAAAVKVCPPCMMHWAPALPLHGTGLNACHNTLLCTAT